MLNENELFSVKGMSLGGRLLVNAPIAVACYILLMAYTYNSGMFINPFAEVLWYSIQWGVFSYVLAYCMGSIAFREQIKEGK